MSLLCCVLPLSSLAAPSEADIRDSAIEVAAELVEIPGKPPPNDLYDYAYVMKYRVRGGDLEGREILVAHFNPLVPRRRIKQEMRRWVAGDLRRFKRGDVHRMKLTPRLADIWKNAVEDHYLDSDRKSTRYWCLEVTQAD
jgi:hypothetical protein